jgi:PPM family protein phosphatase
MEDGREITEPLDAADLKSGWEQKEAAGPSLFAVLRMGAKTDLGQVRENNEDKFDFIEPDDPGVLARKGRVYAVADGMGGHSAGQIASELGLKIFIKSFYQDTANSVAASLKRAVQEANAYIVEVAKQIPGRGGMGTTLTAAVVRDDMLTIAQVGDSRLYLLRAGEIRQLTEDHSWVAEHVRRGTMTKEEAENSPHRNVITRSLGGALEVTPDLYEVKLKPGDRYLLCSDGLSGMVTDEDLLKVAGSDSPSVAAWNLVEMANAHGGLDNVTALIIEVLALEPQENQPPPATAAAAEPADAGAEVEDRPTIPGRSMAPAE